MANMDVNESSFFRRHTRSGSLMMITAPLLQISLVIVDLHIYEFVSFILLGHTSTRVTFRDVTHSTFPDFVRVP